MQRCQAYPHLFTPDRIEVIFANIMELLTFQQKFLLRLETCVTPADLSQSQIGAAFLDHVSLDKYILLKYITLLECETLDTYSVIIYYHKNKT